MSMKIAACLDAIILFVFAILLFRDIKSRERNGEPKSKWKGWFAIFLIVYSIVKIVIVFWRMGNK